MAVILGGGLRIVYLLEDTPLFGGVKVALHHANLLLRYGHEVTVVSPGSRPDWYPVEAEFRSVPGFSGETVPPADIVIATYWTTIAPALALGSGRVVHFCQGYEASYTHNRGQHAEIEAAYRHPLPAFVVSPYLARLLRERFGRPARVVTPALEDDGWRPRLRFGPRRRPRILVMGPFEIDWKGAATALEALTRLRADGLDLEVVRISQWPLSDAERSIVEPDEFHCHLAPSEVARVVAGCDLLLAPSWEQEGFGLPVLEAMACGVPVVASRIAAFRDWAGDAAELVPPDDAAAFADAARSLLREPGRWRRRRRRGLATAARFRERRVAKRLLEAVGWAAGGDRGRGS